MLMASNQRLLFNRTGGDAHGRDGVCRPDDLCDKVDRALVTRMSGRVGSGAEPGIKRFSSRDMALSVRAAEREGRKCVHLFASLFPSLSQ